MSLLSPLVSSPASEAVTEPRLLRSSPVTDPAPPSEPGYQVIRRNGAVSPFDQSKIAIALTKAFLAVEGSTAAASRRVHDIVADLTAQIVANLTRRAGSGRTFHIEDIQDQAELALMRSEHHKVARAYVLYREARAKERAKAEQESATTPAAQCQPRSRKIASTESPPSPAMAPQNSVAQVRVPSTLTPAASRALGLSPAARMFSPQWVRRIVHAVPTTMSRPM